jgi:hypothetical protein
MTMPIWESDLTHNVIICHACHQPAATGNISSIRYTDGQVRHYCTECAYSITMKAILAEPPLNSDGNVEYNIVSQEEANDA